MDDRSTRASGFDGLAGRMAALVMAHANRDMEMAAITELNGGRDHGCILSIGFGPGVGIAELARRRPDDMVAGIDPSPTMIEVASRRNRAAIETGRVVLRQAGAEAIPWPGDSFDAVVAVNSIQLWSPLTAAIAEVARVVRPGGMLVTLTHAWAVEKRTSLDEWVESASRLLTEHGFAIVTSGTEGFRSGRALTLHARYRSADDAVVA
ncbi:MAG TPA: class I SAM-dependent methyltransferase [Acidimicrobiales bacterium]|nr:class I SAM-dependent methyltransferase [Acidimicrobiales bacterium]